MRTDRRGFFGALFVAAAVRTGLRSDDATRGVPRRVDCRKGDTAPDLNVFRYGRRLDRVVAYDLDEDWADVMREGPDGQVAVADDQIATVRLQGSISVRWIPR